MCALLQPKLFSIFHFLGRFLSRFSLKVHTGLKRLASLKPPAVARLHHEDESVDNQIVWTISVSINNHDSWSGSVTPKPVQLVVVRIEKPQQRFDGRLASRLEPMRILTALDIHCTQGSHYRLSQRRVAAWTNPRRGETAHLNPLPPSPLSTTHTSSARHTQRAADHRNRPLPLETALCDILTFTSIS
ncbi:hypothetical protein RRG08_038339 [Elysia crispata]|uniref:Uncharacterized protein n=1 Tax=Elysia crispata TaxID=231223 RepID=A0AAE1AN85_9GAST|nr:hypothetical protein RRG08_038339 [Elysia crispata]